MLLLQMKIIIVMPWLPKRFAKDFDMFHHEVVITPDIINEVWDDSIKFMEEPRYNWNMPMYFYTE